VQRSTSNPRYVFDSAAGRYIVLGFFVSAGEAKGRAALEAIQANRALFDDARFSFFGISLDPRDEAEGRVRENLPGIRCFWDFDGAVSRLYGSVPSDAKPGDGPVAARQFWLVLDPTLRVLTRLPVADDGRQSALFDYLAKLPPPDRFAGFEIQAPVLILPNVFEPEFCQKLIDTYEAHGGEESGFMRDVDGKTVMVHDHSHKRRRDHIIQDEQLIKQLQARVRRRINPEIAKVHCFTPTRMERYIVSCYTAEDAGHFRPHRDNTTNGTAHRRFAVSINLNSDFDGGTLSFPEYGPRSYKMPTGGAVVFSCSLMHAVSPVTRGRRYAFLPFLYDEAAAKVREANNKYLGEGVQTYKGA
jgi:predicted 2-oxoglutarate/Fe(II)-dependent dioxygenase YbiX